MKKRTLSLNSKLLTWALLFTLPIIFLFYLGTSLAMHSFEHQLTAANEQILKPYLSAMEVTLDEIRNYVAYREIPTDILNRIGSGSELAQLNTLLELNQYYSEDITAHDNIDAIFLLHNGVFRFMQNRNGNYPRQCEAADFVSQLLASAPYDEILRPMAYTSFESNKEPYFLLSLQEENTIWGCWIRASSFLEAIDTEQIQGLEQLQILPTASTQNFPVPDDGRYFIVKQPSARHPLQLVALLDRQQVFSSYKNLTRLLELMIFLSVLILFFYLFYLRTHLSQPLRNLVVYMNHLKTHDFSPLPVPDHLDAELRQVYETANAMSSRIVHLKIGIYEEELKQQRLNMQLLQMEIKPHFFLNSLTTIIGYVKSGDYPMVQKMALCLSRHFRYILYNGDLIPLEEELNYIKNYLEIRQMQTHLPFSLEIQVEEALYEEEIPVLSVQTFVENVFKYTDRDDICIRIQVRMQTLSTHEERLILSVADNGQGFPDEFLQKWAQGAPIDPGQKKTGIGLSNVRERLLFLYHGKAGLQLANLPEGGAYVEMQLPVRTQKEEELL